MRRSVVVDILHDNLLLDHRLWAIDCFDHLDHLLLRGTDHLDLLDWDMLMAVDILNEHLFTDKLWRGHHLNGLYLLDLDLLRYHLADHLNLLGHLDLLDIDHLDLLRSLLLLLTTATHRTDTRLMDLLVN